jgi:hypothetical protein
MAHWQLNRRRWSAAYAVVACLTWAGTCLSSEPLAGLMACREVVNPAARLACFDREAAALAPNPAALAGAATAETPAASAAVPPVPVLNSQQQFGLPERQVAAHEVAAGTRSADASSIEAHILRLAPAADGRVVFTLDNGQVWRQLVLEGDLLAKPGDVVTLSRGFLGSFWLQLPNGRGCKVSRLH